MPKSMTELESILVCPTSRAPLRALSSAELLVLIERIQQKKIVAKQPLESKTTLSGAFQVIGIEKYYPVVDGIIGLLPSLVLMSPEISACKNYTLNQTNLDQQNNHNKQLQPNPDDDQIQQEVQQFYNTFGWQASQGIYQDAQDSEDLRGVSQGYIAHCHARLQDFLPQHGQYLLDIASGPIQYDAYLPYGKSFAKRLCADISFTALQAAQRKLGSRGIYLLCDITQLPLKPDCIDAIISLHTVYHVPKERQSLAFDELHRVLKPQGVSLIVYSWGRYSVLMGLTLLPLKLWDRFKQRFSPKKSTQKSLYFHADPYRWMRREIMARYGMQLRVWRSVSVPFLKTYVHAGWGGSTLLRMIRTLEERFPHFMGRFGAYPLFITYKTT